MMGASRCAAPFVRGRVTLARRCRIPIACPKHGQHRLQWSNTSNLEFFKTNISLQRARLKGEMKPIVTLAIHSFLSKKQEQMLLPQGEGESPKNRFREAVELLARWNGFEPIDNASQFPSGQLQVGQGLVAETSAFASENYLVLARKSACTKEHPPFVAENYSWYTTLEDRINDNLDRWEENARKRRQQRLHTAKQGLQHVADKVQQPIARVFGAVTAQVGPLVEQVQNVVRSNAKQAVPAANTKPKEIYPEEWKQDEEESSLEQETLSCTWEDFLVAHQNAHPEDLIIVSREGDSCLLLNNVHPKDRLLALPVITTSGGKASPPYRLRLARAGLVITVSIIVLGALPPTYRSLKFILDYPKTAELVMITLVASIGYNLYAWGQNARTRQRELIAAAIQSRLVAREEAALAFLTAGAVQSLTGVLMESYVSLLLSKGDDDDDDSSNTHRSTVDPLVAEIGESLGLFLRSKQQKGEGTASGDEENENQITAVEWEKARASLAHCLAVRL